MRYTSAIHCLPVLGLLFGLSAGAPTAGAYEPPPVQQGKTLDDCAEKLASQGGGWCEIRQSDAHPSISSVWPKNLDKKVHMVVGPRAVLIAWNGAAFDSKRNLLYFMGGGHADYGGNEVYEFDLNTGKWSRLTDPSPLNFLYRVRDATPSEPARYCWAPDMRRVPGATHTYDGVEFSIQTRTIFLVNMGTANGSCFDDKEGQYNGDPRILGESGNGAGLYEFNPSRSEVRNNLAPLTWRRIYTPSEADGIGLSYPRSASTLDGSLLIGNRHRMYTFDLKSGKFGPVALGNADYGDGLTIYNPSNKSFYTNSGKFLIHHGAKKANEIPAANGKSMAVDASGRIFMWDGKDRITSFDPKASKWAVYDWSEAGPREGDGRVYSKWQYVPSHDVFVGLSVHTTGVWIYKHPPDMPALALSTTNPQQYIDQAAVGSTVTIPPGMYNWGLTVKKSLTVKLKDVQLLGIAGRKGIINVNCDGCSVVIEDFHANGRKAGCLSGNCAAIKAEGIKFDLTVRRAEIDNTVMGILTDNRGGRLVVEDSVIKNTGLKDTSRTLGHGIYAGRIDELILRRTTIENVNGDGHILKSRAPVTLLDNARLLGMKGYHSRSIDFPCGGTLTIANSVIQHSENTDNPDIIAIGTEGQICGGVLPSRVAVTNSWVIIDRDRSADERARTYGQNFLFRWRVPLTSVEIKGNHIVNLDRWSTSDTEKGDVVIPDFSSQNQMCEDRASCNLKEGMLPAM